MPARKLTAFGLAFALLVSVCFAQGPFDFDKAEYIKPGATGDKKGEKKGETVPGILRFDGTKKEVQFIEKKGTPTLRCRATVGLASAFHQI